VSVTFVTAFTPAFEECAKRLRGQVRGAGFRMESLRYEDSGNWVQNTRGKVARLLRFFAPSYGPVIWVDADAQLVGEVRRDRLDEWSDTFDFMARRREWDSPMHYLSGVMFLNDTDKCYQFLHRWAEFCENDIGVIGKTDEFWLEETRRELEGRTRLGELPRSYCWLGKDRARDPDVASVFDMGFSKSALPYSDRGLLR